MGGLVATWRSSDFSQHSVKVWIGIVCILKTLQAHDLIGWLTKKLFFNYMRRCDGEKEKKKICGARNL